MGEEPTICAHGGRSFLRHSGLARPTGRDQHGVRDGKEHAVPNVDELVQGARDAVTVRRVYGDPYEKDGVTFIPAAAVRGGGGGGEGEGEGVGSGSGGGFGMTARPVGAFQIKDDQVSWVPAADTTRVIVLAEVALIVALLVFRSVRRARHGRKQ